jgi:trans-2,3-dihydro-3-hydroxyanthranilate isomerase
MASTRLRYLHLDVFTTTRFQGNQLAVFPAPPELTTALMQRIAAEMAFSESTFIYPATGSGDVRMRIFTPAEELPMAGHPTIGSTFALAAEGTIAKGRKEFVFELGVGPTPVSLEWTDDGLAFAWMTQLRPTFGATLANTADLAAAVGIDASDIVAGLPLQVVTCGVPYLMLPLVSRTAVDAVSIDKRPLMRTFADGGVDPVPLFIFTTDTGDPGTTAYSRMLAPMFGIGEDPATGSACGPLGSYLLQYGKVSPEQARQMVSQQGVAMGRPSRIHISIEGAPGAITRVRVGGQSVMVGGGELLI